MKNGLAAFLVLFFNGEIIAEGIKAMLSRIVSSVSFSAEEYGRGTLRKHNANDCELLWKCIYQSRERNPMSDNEQKRYLSWIEQFVKKRVDGIMEGNHIKYYGECAAYIAALGVMISRTVNRNDKHEEDTVKTNDAKITGNEANPYSRETTVGFYLYDIFEANRGSYTSKDLSQEDSFEYYEIFNPLKDDYYCMEWEINLLRLQGSTSIISEFNNYHESLFKKEKEEMVKLFEEGRAQFEEGMQPNFTYYSRNLRTEACCSWGSFFTVVDVANVHMSKKGGAV